MGIVNRLVANKYIRALKRSGDTDPNTLAEVKSNLISCGDSVVPSLINQLDHSDARKHAIEVLGALLSEKTLPLFIEALASEREQVANGVVEILSTVTKFNASALLDYLSIPEVPKGRIHAILERRRNDMDPAALVNFMISCDKETRATVYRLLDGHPNETTSSAILPLLTQEDWWLRSSGLMLIAHHPSERGTTLAISRLKDSNKRVRLQAVRTLGQLKVHAAIAGFAGALKDPDLKVHSAAIDALVDIGDVSAVPYLVDVLKDESEYARRGAVEVLNEVATTDAIKDLLSALRDEDWWVRVRAADALGTLGGEKVVDAVLGLMKSDDVFLKRYAVEILNSVPNKRAVGPLIQSLDDQDWWVRERSIDALGKTGERNAVEPLIDLMERDPATAHLCARALGELEDERAIASLCTLADVGGDEAKREAFDALMKLSNLKTTSPEGRSYIQETLQRYGLQKTSSHMRPWAVKSRTPIPDPEMGRTAESQGVSMGGASFAGPGTFAGFPSKAEVPQSTPAPQPVSTPQPSPLAERTQPEMQGLAHYSSLPPGTVLLNRFRVVRKIGGGGFGYVYLVEDTSIHEELVLKILNPQISMDETMIRRFVHELKYTRKITHKNVIRLHDFLEIEGTHAISMEYFDGSSLSKILRDEGRLEWKRGVAMAQEICEGLQAAHAEKIIHRDIKPPNILIGEDDSVKIVDFGLASMVQQAGSRLTKSGILIGTPHYMAPEQINGGDVGICSDIYSFGALLYEMFSGKPPFEGETAVSILFQHLKSATPVLDSQALEIPEALSGLVQQAMSKEPGARPKSMQEILDKLLALPV